MPGYDAREAAAFDRVVQLFSRVPAQQRVDGSTWTARDVLAHLVTVVRRYTTVPRLGETPRDVDVINADELADLADVDVDELIGQLRDGFRGYRELWVPMGAEHLWPFHGGGRLPTAAVRANWLGELLVHGWDVATSAGQAWPIEADDAADLLAFLQQVVPAYARPGGPVTVDLVPDDAPGFGLRLDGDGVRVVPVGAGAATVTGTAGAVVLLLYQRVPVTAAAQAGLEVRGDPATLQTLFDAVERP